MTSGYYCAIFPFCGGGKKKKKDKKTKAFYDWATTNIPVIREFYFGFVKFVAYQKGFSINSSLLWRNGGLMISEVDSGFRGLHL